MQRDYGGFDPVFPGIAIELASSRARDIFNAALQPVFDGNAWRAGDDPEEWFDVLSVQSAFSHESRHFHDALIAPYGARVFGHRFRQIVHVYQILPSLLQDDANSIPLPVPAWCQLDVSAREKVIRRLGRHPSAPSWKPVALPFLSEFLQSPRPKTAPIQEPQTLAWLVQEGWADEQRILEISRRAPDATGQRPHAWQIMELSALAVQLQEIYSVSGYEPANFFDTYLRARDDDPYGLILRMAELPWRRRGQPRDNDLVAGMTLWSLMGSFSIDEWNASPELRFERLLVHLANEGPCDAPDDWWPLWDQWSRKLKLSTVQQGIEDTRRLWQRVVDIADQAARHGERLEDRAPLLQRVARGFQQASEEMLRIFAAEPDAYTRPLNYLQNSHKWFQPQVRLMFPGAGVWMDKSIGELEREGFVVHWGQEGKHGCNVSSMLYPLRSKGRYVIDSSDALDLYSNFALVDGMFGQHAFSRNSDARRSVQEFFKEAGIVPFVVFHTPASSPQSKGALLPGP